MDTTAKEKLKQKVADIRKAAARVTSRETLEKMAGDLLQVSREHTSNYHRRGEYLSDGGSAVQMLKMCKSKEEVNDLFTTRTMDDEFEAFKKWQDEVLLATHLLTKTHPIPEPVNPRSLKLWRRGAARFEPILKAMSISGGSNQGEDWIPTLFSSQLIDTFHLAQRVESLFMAIDPMPSNPYKLPLLTVDGTVKLLSESTSDSASKIGASTPTTSNVTLDVVKLGIRMLFSEEIDEDSIIPIMPFLMKKLAQNMAFGVEDALINGDTSGTHQDSDVTDSDDPRKAWPGLRKLCQSGNKLDVGGAALTLTHVRTIRGYMFKYGVDPSSLTYITSATGMLQFLNIEEVITLDKYGPKATVLTGEIGRIDNIPIVISEKVREDMNGSAVYDGTTKDSTMALLVKNDTFTVGTRRRLTLKSWTDIERDQQVLVGTLRKDFKPLYDHTVEDIMAMAYDIPIVLTS